MKLILAMKIPPWQDSTPGCKLNDKVLLPFRPMAKKAVYRVPYAGWALTLIFILLMLPTISMGEDCGMPATIKEVKTLHEDRMLRLPGVVSVGIGQDENGNPAIIVGLERPHPETESQLPDRLEGYPVTIRIVGRIKAQ